MDYRSGNNRDVFPLLGGLCGFSYICECYREEQRKLMSPSPECRQLSAGFAMQTAGPMGEYPGVVQEQEDLYHDP